MPEEIQPQKGGAQAGTPMLGPNIIADAKEPLSKDVEQDTHHDGVESLACGSTEDRRRSGDACRSSIQPLNGEEIESVLERLRFLWRHGRDARIEIGRLLIRLHELLCKPGYGTFMKVVSEAPPVGLGIPYTTARDYMETARQADRPYDIRNDEHENADILIVDHAAEIAEAVEQEKATVAQAEAAGEYSDIFRIDCRLPPELHTKCRERIKLLGLQEVGRRLYQSLFPEESNGDQSNYAASYGHADRRDTGDLHDIRPLQPSH
jgi:hypothetical protein